MTLIRDRPSFTLRFDSEADFKPDDNSLYIYAESEEDRSRYERAWFGSATSVTFAHIQNESEAGFEFVEQGEAFPVRYRSGKDAATFWSRGSYSCVYVDITGLTHSCWAVLVKSLIRSGMRAFCVYAEPQSYRTNDPQSHLFDLSKATEVGPLPGLVNLSSDVSPFVFVPLLGFEGSRFQHMIEHVNAEDRDIIPIVGVPGFRPEFPFHAYLGNQQPLRKTKSWANVRYATANCPFDLVYTLREISNYYPDRIVKIATIGTKPHALGAVVYSLARADDVEILYDHPIRKRDRSQGKMRMLVYDLERLALASA